MILSSNPESQNVQLALPELGIVLDTWKSYHFDSNFLTPTDAFHFVVGDDQTGDELLQKILPGRLVTLSVSGHIQASGYVDTVNVRTSRDGGTEISVEGRDLLSPVVDANVDPLLRFNERQTLYDIVSSVFGQYGFSDIIEFNDSNRNIQSGQTRGAPTTKLGKIKTSFLQHQVKPYPGEGAFAFCSRISQRLGLWIWLSADGKQVVISTPDFDQPARYNLVHKRGSNGINNNILEGEVSRTAMDQPTVIFATGVGGGAENRYSQLAAYAVNPSVEDDGTLAALVSRYPNAVSVGSDYPFTPYPTTRNRAMYLHDDESHNLAQLQNFVTRELALRQRKAMTVNYTVEGHICNGNVWTVDTVVDVQDDISNVHEKMYVLGRTFTKDRNGGTKTHLELIRLNTLVF